MRTHAEHAAGNDPARAPAASIASACAAVVLGVVGLFGAGCAGPGVSRPGDTSAVVRTDAAPSEHAPETAPSVTIEDWTYEGDSGKCLCLPHHRIFTTTQRASLEERLPIFVNAALAHYRSAITPLPAPGEEMELYVFENRPQWERMTKRVMGSEADTYLRIQRGGFTSRGRAILYDIGPRDTFAITAHEGWHQYTQSTFREQLPTTFEEGIAAFMEGFRWRGEQRTEVAFMPWANFERFGQLREAKSRGTLVGLPALIRSSPQELMERGADGALTYYAQSWALIHFLREGEQGSLRPALEAMLRDAALGGLRDRCRKAGERGRNPDLLRVYTGKSAEELDGAYRAFIDDIVRVGTMQRVGRGESPLSGTSDAAK